ncbi:MAG: hypothetical protein QNJ38_11190, partial [Prochloraceae cyanobacterium]|nr:hypothetical protein [Prochloraceae cyanobacterium]
PTYRASNPQVCLRCPCIPTLNQRLQRGTYSPSNSPKVKNQKRLLDESLKPLAKYRSEELAQMKIDFRSATYNTARYNFVRKICPERTPLHLAKHRQAVGNLSDCCRVILPRNTSLASL